MTNKSHSILFGGRRIRAAQVRFTQGLRLILMVGVFLFAWFGQSQNAHATASGMCSDLAESIAAPPTFYPASNTMLTDCGTRDDKSARSDAPGIPNDQLQERSSSAEQDGVLERDPFYASPEDVTRLLEIVTDQTDTEEHRARGLRPPRV